MRIVISDYDGTMYVDGKLRGDIVAAVTKWQEAGNRFGIATGRDYNLTIHETNRWGIPFDFLICINGAALYDHDCSLLQSRHIDNAAVPAILQHPAAMASIHCQLSGTSRLRVLLREGSWFPRVGVPFERIDFETALAARNLCQISLAFTDEAECEEWDLMLREDLGDVIEPHRNRVLLDITPAGVDKAAGIADLLALKEWQGRQVFVIGDGGNDLSMIEKYGGFTVPNAAPAIAKAAKRQFDTVSDLLYSL